MPSAIVLTGRITTTAAEGHPLQIHINSESDTVHPLTGTIDGDDAAIAAGVARERLHYWSLELDLGAGFESIHESEYRVRSISASRSDWARRCEIELYGARWNPLLQAAVRGTIPVRVSVTTGDPSQPVTRVKFRGYGVAAPYNKDTKTTSLSCLDAASLKASGSIGPSNEANSGITREAFFIREMEAADITVGAVDFGPLATTPINKPFSQVDLRPLDFARGWIEPAGGWIQFNDDDELMVERYSATMPPALILSPDNVVSLGPLTPPSAVATNKFTAITINYDRTDPTGIRTISFSQTTVEDYAIKGAVFEVISGGAPSPVSYGDAVPVSRVTRRVDTTQSFIGDMLLSSREVEWGWYAWNSVRLELESDGTTVDEATLLHVYQYADGSWRAEKREQWRPIKVTDIRKYLSSTALVPGTFVVRQVEQRSFPFFIPRALFELTGGPPPTETQNGGGSPIWMTEDGQGTMEFYDGLHAPTVYTATGDVIAGIPAERVTTNWVVDDEDLLVSETETVEGYARGSQVTSARAGGFVYGFDSKEYWSDEEASLQPTSIRRKRYQKIDDESYFYGESVTEPATHKVDTLPTKRVTSTRPRPETIEPRTLSQELRQSASDLVRIALCGVFEDFISSEYCQGDSDLLAIARSKLREESSWSCAFILPIDHIARPGHYVEIDGYEEDGLDGLRMIIDSIDRDPDSCTQSGTLRWYPPEVADGD